MIRAIATLLVLLQVNVGATSADNQAIQTYRGEYFYNFETAAFTAEGSAEAWCVDASKLQAAELPAEGDPNGRWGTAHVVVMGILSSEGRYCNLGAYKRFLDIKEVLEIRDKKRRHQ